MECVPSYSITDVQSEDTRGDIYGTIGINSVKAIQPVYVWHANCNIYQVTLSWSLDDVPSQPVVSIWKK